MTAHWRKEAEPVHAETVRKDFAVHVSLSSDSLVKQPGNLAVSILPASRRTDEI